MMMTWCWYVLSIHFLVSFLHIIHNTCDTYLYLPTYLPTYLLTLPTYLPTYLRSIRPCVTSTTYVTHTTHRTYITYIAYITYIICITCITCKECIWYKPCTTCITCNNIHTVPYHPIPYHTWITTYIKIHSIPFLSIHTLLGQKLRLLSFLSFVVARSHLKAGDNGPSHNCHTFWGLGNLIRNRDGCFAKLSRSINFVPQVDHNMYNSV